MTRSRTQRIQHTRKLHRSTRTTELSPFIFVTGLNFYLLPFTFALVSSAAGLHLTLKRDGFLVVRINLDSVAGVGYRLRAVAALHEDATENYVRVNRARVPEDRRA